MIELSGGQEYVICIQRNLLSTGSKSVSNSSCNHVGGGGLGMADCGHCLPRGRRRHLSTGYLWLGRDGVGVDVAGD